MKCLGLILSCLAFALLCPDDNAHAAADLPPVVIAQSGRAAVVQEITVTGSVTSPRVAQISTRIAGSIVAMNVEVGDVVDKGQHLLVLDDELSTIALQGARATLRATHAELDDAQRLLAEARRLELDSTIAKTEVLAREAAVNIKAAAVERSEADVRQAAAVLERHVLKAPFAGTISRKSSNPGEWVVPGTPVLELVATDNLRIDFQVPQEAYPHLSVGMAIAVRLDALPGREVQGHIIGVVPLSDDELRSFLVLCRLDASTAAIAPGMSARGILRLQSDRDGVVVPRDAVLRHADGRVTVWLIDRHGRGVSVSERVITIGRSFAGLVEVKEGLDPGMEVVVRGNERLQQGQRVSIVEQ